MRPVGGYPGPIALRPSARLVCARQTDDRARAFVVGKRRFIPFTSEFGFDSDVKYSDWIIHMSWVRQSSFFDEKARNNGHVNDFDWFKEKIRWESSVKNPILHCAKTPFTRERQNYDRHTIWRKFP
jgi:hypothetical protein